LYTFRHEKREKQKEEQLGPTVINFAMCWLTYKIWQSLRGNCVK